MNTFPYHIIPFKFNDDSQKLLDSVIPDYVNQFEKNSNERGGNLTLSNDRCLDDGAVGDQFREIFKKVGVKEFKVQLFIYRNRRPQDVDWAKGNPHIDQYGIWPNIISFNRFNVLYEGTQDYEYQWWPHIDENNTDQLEWYEYTIYTGGKSKRLQLKGVTDQERWAAIGSPTFTATHLSEIGKTASFVKANCLHNLAMKPNRRIVVSARIPQPWETLDFSKLNND
jgi:hypothetical protein